MAESNFNGATAMSRGRSSLGDRDSPVPRRTSTGHGDEAVEE